MSENQFRKLSALANKLKEEATRESAIKTMVGAGILNEKLEFTPPYKELGRIMKPTK